LQTVKGKRIGFISTRLAGTDGVSLETAKWVQVLEEEGLECFFMAGELDTPDDRSFLVSEAHFTHPEILALQKECFNVSKRDPKTTEKINKLKDKLKVKIYKFVDKFKIDLLIPENALAIPVNIPLGLAITEFISETGMPVIAHHHDFFWERKRFLVNAVWEYLNMAFPPHLPSIQHVVINSSGDNQLSLRTGVSGTVIPNVMNFESPPQEPDQYSADVREALGLEDDELFVLQPTRVVKRKGIEHAIELVKRLDVKARLVISHASGDEGDTYEQRVRDYSDLMGVKTLFVSDIIDEKRGRTPDGRKIYTLCDIYPHADLVTYPSTFEGFGNAFLEAVYFKKPIGVNKYSIYSIDIEPKGFKVVELDDYVTSQAVKQTRALLGDPEKIKEVTEHNYKIAQQYYSYSTLKQKLRMLLSNCFGV